jgi:ribosomal protein S18 acetylase RimI-like enzyme
MSDVIVRDASTADSAAVARVHIDSWRFAYQGIMPDEVLDRLTIEERTGQWNARIADWDVFVAVDGGRVVGFCELLRRTGQPPYIRALYIDPADLRRGLGTLLVDEAARRLRAAGEAEVTLQVVAENKRARAFYRRSGFVETGNSEWNGMQCVDLRLELGQPGSGG